MGLPCLPWLPCPCRGIGVGGIRPRRWGSGGEEPHSHPQEVGKDKVGTHEEEGGKDRDKAGTPRVVRPAQQGLQGRQRGVALPSGGGAPDVRP